MAQRATVREEIQAKDRDPVLEEIQAKDPRYKQKHDDAVSLIALVKLQGLSRPKAWRKLFPQDAEKSDNALALRAGRLERWHRNHFPPNLFEMLTRNHLGIPRVAQELQRMLKATRFDQHSKQREPDWDGHGRRSTGSGASRRPDLDDAPVARQYMPKTIWGRRCGVRRAGGAGPRKSANPARCDVTSASPPHDRGAGGPRDRRSPSIRCCRQASRIPPGEPAKDALSQAHDRLRSR